MPRTRFERLLVVQHDADKGLGLLEPPLRASGLELDVRSAGRDPIVLDGHAGVVALPGLANPSDETPAVLETRALLRAALSRDLPILGICLGAELLAQAAGAEARRCRPEYGYCRVVLSPDGPSDPLLGSLPAEFSAFQAHAYAASLPGGAVELAESEHALQAFRLGGRAWGIQFHPEPTPAMIASWIGTIGRDMEQSGVLPEEVAVQARERTAVSADRAARIAEGFAAVVRTDF